MKLISVVIIVRNEEKRIKQCLESLLIQKGINDTEILIVDGSSTDKTVDIVNEFVKKYSFIKLVRCPSYGYSLQRNFGAYAASGQYILYISGDTIIAANLIQRYVKAIEDGYDVVQGTVVNIAGKSMFSKYMAKIYPVFYNPYLNTVYEQFSTINVLIKKEMIINRPFNENIESLEDKEWCFHNINTVQFKRIQGAVVFHIVHETLQQYCNKIHNEALALGEIIILLKREEKQLLNIFNWINWTKCILLVFIAVTVLSVMLVVMNVSIFILIIPILYMIICPIIFLFRILKHFYQNRIISSFIIYLFFYMVVSGVLRGVFNRKRKKTR